MPERDYFSLRYTVPGFVFILIVFGTNYSVILNIISRSGAADVLSVSLAILSLFTSSAIGFLISQIWFFIFHLNRTYANILRKPEHDIEDSMKKSFGWIPKDKTDKKRDEIMGTAIDYILNCFKAEENNLFKFFQRKIDLFHTMSSTLISLIIGLGLGLAIRLGLYYFGRYPFVTLLDSFLFLFTIVATCIFTGVLCFLRSEIFFEYHPMLKLFLNSVKEDEDLYKDLHEVYPEYINKIDKK